MNLKKLFFCFYFLVLSHWSYCQRVEKGDQFVTVGYGVLSLYELGAFGDAMAQGNNSASEVIEHFSGPVCLTYGYYVSDGISLGIAARYEWGIGSLYNISYDYQTAQYYQGSFNDNLFTAGPEMQIIYTNHYKYQCYGAINVSMTYRHRKDSYYDYVPIAERDKTPNKWIPKGQLTFWGCRFGEGHLKGYIEIGMGYRGLVNGGIGYLFH